MRDSNFNIISASILLVSMILLIVVVYSGSIGHEYRDSFYIDDNKEDKSINNTQIANEVVMLQEQKENMEKYVNRLIEIAGRRKDIISELNDKLTHEGLVVKIDEKTGDIGFAEGLFFDTDKEEISGEGKAFLDRFMPIYLSILFNDDNKHYVEEVIISGYTDDNGTYLYNLELSQKRAMSVMNYIFAKDLVRIDGVDRPEAYFTISGRSYSELILDNGVMDKNRSRRVGFGFRLKDEEIIDEMQKIVEGDR